MEHGNRRRLKYTSNTKSRVPPKNMNNHTKTTIRVVSPPSPPPPVRNSTDSYPPLKKGRGPTRGKDTDTIVQMSGKIKLDFNTESGRPKDSDKSAKFSNECGYLIRKFAPLQFKKWSAIPAMDTQPLVDRLLSKFDLDMSKTYITKYVHEIMGQRYRTYRYDLHQHFKQFETVEEARLHPPDDVTQEDWDYLCNLFSLEKFKKRATINSENREKLPFNHRGGSKPFAFHRQHNSMSVATGELQGEVELFRATHYNESKGWINDTAKSRYEEMRKLQEQSTQDGDTPISDLEITQRVLGKRSGYIRGLGYGSRLKRSTTTEFPDEETERLRQQITKLEEFKTTATTQLEELKAMIQTLMPQQTNTSNQPPPHSSSTSQPPPSPSS